ncbi:hydrogenase expression/formation C-terminal domain-containing protein [Falsiroseomonas sp. CW058]|uniref:hydrogenase expression/formation C-terminal domain-containing protein n=1 Tax=Falsiroseomonas sp. CW058 TaxID=3388664 RepID=UPI003D31EBCC
MGRALDALLDTAPPALRDRADAPRLIAGSQGVRRPSSRLLGAGAGPAAAAFLRSLAAALRGAGAADAIPLASLPPGDRRAVLDLLGEGEVRIEIAPGPVLAVESVMPGVWRIRDAAGGPVRIEAGEVPAVLREALARCPAAPPAGGRPDTAFAEEVARLAAGFAPGAAGRVLAPDPAAMPALAAWLGEGPVRATVLGYGGVEVSATRSRHLWRLRHHDARGGAARDTIEVGDIPEALRAAPQDMADSAERLEEVVKAFAR